MESTKQGAQVQQLRAALPLTQPEAEKRERLLRLPEVEAVTGLRKSAIYAGMKSDPPTFVRCVRISARCVAWPASLIDQWIEERKASSLPFGDGA